MIFKIINFVLFQAGWFIGVLGASYNHTYLALTLSTVILLVHFVLIKNRILELKLIIIAGLIGFLFDEEIEKLQEKIADKYGYRLVDHKLELYGVKKKS